MNNVVELGEIQREKIEHSIDKGLVTRTVNFLCTYGFRSIDIKISIIESALFKGKKNVKEVAAFYLNWILTKNLGDDFFLKGGSREICEKFNGVILFIEGDQQIGVFRWVADKIGQERFRNFRQAHNFLREGWTKKFEIIKGEEILLIDPFIQPFDKDGYRIRICWSPKDGSYFFVINFRKSQIIKAFEGQSYKDIFEEIRRNYS